MKKILKEREKGITLIALVITIIVLLILAGVSIAMLTGDNGIITRANEASEKTKKSNAEEQVDIAVQGSYGTNGKINIDSLNDELKNIEGLKYKGKEISESNKIESLPDKVNLDGNEIIINEDGSANRIIRMEEYQTEDTKPYLPGSEFKQVEGTNLENGLVVTEGTNYWTWIEVPITDVFKTAKAEDEYDKIEDDLEAYTVDLVDREGYTDQWYDYYGMSYDGSSGYGQVKFSNSSKFDEAKEYYGAIYTDNTGTTEATSFKDRETIYYVKIDNKLEDDRGCGLTYKEYNDLKKYMLSSLYTNGGFWIGQYEGGADSYPATAENDIRKLVIQQGAYPYNYITCADAQKKSNELNSGDYKSSLMFGIQWDLVLKHLQVKGKMTVADLTSDSKNWGNYVDSTFTIENGKYTTSALVSNPNSFKAYTESTSGYVENRTKLEKKSVLLTTGANSSQNMKMNIYDLAGNVGEWTLEKSTNPDRTCAHRGSYYGTIGTYTASYRNSSITTYSNIYYGFRSALY